MNNMMPFPIHIVDDDASIREACHFLLESINETASLWPDGKTFLEQVDTQQASIVILDVRMPHMDGQTVFSQIQAQKLPMAVIFLTGHGDIGMAVESLQQGAIDFLEKPLSLIKLQSALMLAKNTLYTQQKQSDIRLQYKNLSPKEQLVAQLVYQGLTNKSMAEQLNVSLRTIEVQRASAMQKMQAQSLASFILKLEHCLDNASKA